MVPWEEHQVGERNLVADEISRAGLLEARLNDASDALDFVPVAVDRRGDIFRMVLNKASVNPGTENS